MYIKLRKKKIWKNVWKFEYCYPLRLVPSHCWRTKWSLTYMHEILFPQQVAMFWPRVIIPDSSKCIVYIVKYYVCVLLDHHLLSSIDCVLFSMFMENVLVIAEGAAFILCIIALVNWIALCNFMQDILM